MPLNKAKGSCIKWRIFLNCSPESRHLRVIGNRSICTQPHATRPSLKRGRLRPSVDGRPGTCDISFLKKSKFCTNIAKASLNPDPFLLIRSQVDSGWVYLLIRLKVTEYSLVEATPAALMIVSHCSWVTLLAVLQLIKTSAAVVLIALITLCFCWIEFSSTHIYSAALAGTGHYA